MTRTDADPEELARIVAGENGTEAMLPVITKELYHQYILGSMREQGFLDRLVFQGGTSLRLCHGSPRYSEDLDFAGGPDFSLEDFAAMGECIRDTLSRVSPTAQVRVRDPRREGMVNRWRINIRTAEQTKDMPSQIIKLEVAAVAAHDPRLAVARIRYPQLAGVFAPIPLTAESIEEILADKMLSYVAADYVRYRDLWDMGWLTMRGGIDEDHVWAMATDKQDDYGEHPDWKARLDSDRDVTRVIESRGFTDELTRFIAPSARPTTIDDPLWRRSIAMCLTRLFSSYIAQNAPAPYPYDPTAGFASSDTHRTR